MLRLKRPEEKGLAMPESTPVTLIQVDSDNLPYACHCPLCGGIFQLPEALLYKVQEDAFEDEDQGAEPTEVKGSSTSMGSEGPGMETGFEAPGEELETGGDENVAAV